MWFVKFIKNEKGSATIEYLVLALLIVGAATTVVAGIKAPLTNTHNNAVNNITSITGSGY